MDEKRWVLSIKHGQNTLHVTLYGYCSMEVAQDIANAIEEGVATTTMRAVKSKQQRKPA